MEKRSLLSPGPMQFAHAAESRGTLAKSQNALHPSLVKRSQLLWLHSPQNVVYLLFEQDLILYAQLIFKLISAFGEFVIVRIGNIYIIAFI